MLWLLCAPQLNSVVPSTTKGFILLYQYSRDSLRQRWPKQKLTTKFFTLSAIMNIRSIFRKIRREIYVRKPKHSFLKVMRCFLSARRTVSFKDGFTGETRSSRYWKLVTLTNLPRTLAATRRYKRFVHNSVMLLLNFKIVVPISFIVPNCCVLVLLSGYISVLLYSIVEGLRWNCKASRGNVCLRTSKKFEKPAQLHPIKVKDPKRPVAMSTWSPVLSNFSKWPEAAPLRSNSAKGM